MTFFKIIYRVVYTLGLYLMITVTAFVMVAVLEPHQERSPRQYDNLPVYKTDEVATFKGYKSEDEMVLIVKFKEDPKDSFLIEYALYYNQEYGLPVELETERGDEPLFVKVNRDGKAFIK